MKFIKITAATAFFMMASTLSFAPLAQAQKSKQKTTLSAKSENGKYQFSFTNAEIADVLALYSKISGQKFVIDSEVKGKTTIMTPSPVTPEEIFHLISTSLATNGYAISEQGDTMVVMSARRIQRSLHPVATDLPQLKPEKMVTMVFKLKHVTGDEINKRLRVLPSKDGEISPMDDKVIITDWISNLHRVAKVLAEVDQPQTQKK